METYLQKDYITIKYHKAHILISEWLCAFTSSEFREGMNEIITAMEHFKTGKTIWILTNGGALHPDDRNGHLRIGNIELWLWAIRMLPIFMTAIFLLKWRRRYFESNQYHVAYSLF